MLKDHFLTQIIDRKTRNFVIYGIGQVFNLLSPLVLAPFIVMVCKEAGLGKIGLGFAMSLFLILIVDYAFDIKGTKIAAENRDRPEILQKLLSTAIFTKIFLFTITLVIALFLIELVPFVHQEKQLFLLSMTIVLAQVFNPVWFLQGIEDFTAVSAINIFSKITYVTLVLTLITKPTDYVFVNLYLGSSSFIFNGFGLLYIRYKHKLTVIVPTASEVKTILRNDFTFCISQLCLSVRQLSPLVLTGYFLGFTFAGQYKIVEQVINTFRTFIQVFLKFFYPQVCYKFNKDIRDGWQFWKKYTAANIALVVLMLTVIFIFSTNILRFFHLSEASIVSLNGLFRLSLLISFMMSLSLPLEQLMFVNDKSKIYIRITIFAAVINVVVILALIHSLELKGVIVALITSELFFISMYFYNAYLYTKQLVKNEI